MTAPVNTGAASLPLQLQNHSPQRQLPAVDRSKVDPMTLQAAEGMEAMFLDYMMKVMRQTVPKSEMSLQSPATQVYQGMLDSEWAQTAARTGGVGLADQIIAYLESRKYTGRGTQSPQAAGKVAGGAVSGEPAKGMKSPAAGSTSDNVQEVP